MKCIECNAPIDIQAGDKPFCNDECETKFNIAESPVNNWNCMNCNGPLGFEPDPADPPFCSTKCEVEFMETCYNCEGDGWVLINDNGLPNQDTCPDCNGSGKHKK